MKEELQDKLVEILGSIQTSVGSAKDFALTQLPDVAQSYLTYGRVLYSFVFAASILLLITAVILFVLGRRADRLGAEQYANARKSADEAVDGVKRFYASSVSRFDFPSGEPFRLATIPVMAAGLACALVSVDKFLLVWFAPKVWLLKELAGLVK